MLTLGGGSGGVNKIILHGYVLLAFCETKAIIYKMAFDSQEATCETQFFAMYLFLRANFKKNAQHTTWYTEH